MLVHVTECENVSISNWNDFTDANGAYTRQGVDGGKSYWRNTRDGLYLRFDDTPSIQSWLMDDDLVTTNGIYDQLFAGSQFPPSGAKWLFTTAPPTITCADAGMVH